MKKSAALPRAKARLARHFVTAAIVSLALAAFQASPQAQGLVVGPSCISPLLCRGLVVDSLSVYGTMPDANGVQQVTTSFRVVNKGPTVALPSSTLVQSAGELTYLATPALHVGAAAFFSSTTNTTLTDFNISATTANHNSASFHFLSNTTALGRWRPIGPSAIVDGEGNPLGVGRIITIALDPTSTNVAYAGSTNSGLWKTTDGGAHWVPLTDALPTANIYAVTLDETDPKHVFIATPAGIFGSTDGGQVWSLLNSTDFKVEGSDGGMFIVRHIIQQPVLLGPQGTATAAATASTSADTNTASTDTPTASPSSFVFPGLPTTPLSPEIRLYLSTQNGLIVSRDGGVTWLKQVLGAPTNSGIKSIIASLDQDRSNPDHMLATVTSFPNVQYPGVGVYETYDGGLAPGSWHLLQGCPGAPAPDFSPNAFPVFGQIWVTQSHGTQWISDRARVVDANGKTIGIDHELWRTTGQTCTVNGFPEHGWQLLSSGFNTPCIGDAKSPSSWSFLHADPANPNILYKAGVHLCRSTDGGLSWTAMTGVLHDDHHVLLFHPASPSTLLEGNDGGLYRSDDGGQSWAYASAWLQVTEFLDVDQGGAAPRNIVGGSQDNEMSSTNLTSPVWRNIDLAGDGDPDGDRSLVQVDPLDATVQYTVGQAADHLSKVKNGARDVSSQWQWDTNTSAMIDPFNGLPEQCSAYDTVPNLFTQFLATSNSDWHLLSTVGLGNSANSGCDGGIWAGPPWHSVFVPPASDNEALRRLAYDADFGLFLAGGSRGSVYIGARPDIMAKLWVANSGIGKVSAIVPDPARPAHYFVSLEYVGLDLGSGRIFEISASPINFTAQDITANLTPGRVMTIAANSFEPDVLYAGTAGAGIWRGVRDANGNWTWRNFNNGLPQGAVVTKLRVAPDGTIYAGTYGRGTFALDTVANVVF